MVFSAVYIFNRWRMWRKNWSKQRSSGLLFLATSVMMRRWPLAMSMKKSVGMEATKAGLREARIPIAPSSSLTSLSVSSFRLPNIWMPDVFTESGIAYFLFCTRPLPLSDHWQQPAGVDFMHGFSVLCHSMVGVGVSDAISLLLGIAARYITQLGVVRDSLPLPSNTHTHNLVEVWILQGVEKRGFDRGREYFAEAVGE